MAETERSRRVSLACAAAALAVSGVAAAASMSVRDWRPSALVRMSASEPLAELAREGDPRFAFVDPAAHYDGVYFYAIARDPFARGEEHQLVDRSAYRYGHAGYGWLAWFASGGRASAVPAALLGVGLAGAAVAAYAAALLARALGRSAWWGLVVGFSPGVVFAITADTSEPVALAAAALALLAWMRRRWPAAGFAIAAGCLIKEPLLLVPAGLAVWETIRWVREGRAGDLGRRAAAIVAGPAIYALWYVYLRARFGVWPFRDEARDFLAAPFSGWWDSLRRAARLAGGSFEPSQLGSAAVPLLAVVGALLGAGLIRSLRPRSPADPVFALTALLVLCLNWYGVLYPKDLIREVAVPLALLPAVLAGPGTGAAPRSAGRPGEGVGAPEGEPPSDPFVREEP